MSSVLTLIGLSELAAGQAQPEVVVNENDAVSLNLLLALRGKDISTPPGSPTEGDAYIVGSSPSGDWSAFSPGNLAVYQNGTWIELTPIDGLVVIEAGGTTWARLWRYTSGAWSDVSPASYDVAVVFGGTPTASEVIGDYAIVRDVEFDANLAGSVGFVNTPPAATFDIDVQDDGGSIGTVSISTTGVFTFSTVGGVAKTIAAGSRLQLVAPSAADASIDTIVLTLKGRAV